MAVKREIVLPQGKSSSKPPPGQWHGVCSACGYSIPAFMHKKKNYAEEYTYTVWCPGCLTDTPWVYKYKVDENAKRK